jgi:hypothetical protein
VSEPTCCRCGRRLVRDEVGDVCVYCRDVSARCTCSDLSTPTVLCSETLSDWIDSRPTVFVGPDGVTVLASDLGVASRATAHPGLVWQEEEAQAAPAGGGR